MDSGGFLATRFVYRETEAFQASDTTGMLQAGSMCIPTSPSWADTRKYARVLIETLGTTDFFGHRSAAASANRHRRPNDRIAGLVPIGHGFGMFLHLCSWLHRCGDYGQWRPN